MSDKGKMEDCGIYEHCKSPLKKIYHYDGRGTNTPSTVEYFCKCPKMNDERREILKHFNEITKEYHQHCEWTNDKYSAVEQIRQLIQQKPEIDDTNKYVEEKARVLYESLYPSLGIDLPMLELMENFITQIIRDVKGK